MLRSVLAAAAVCAAPVGAQSGGYLVLSAVAAADPFDAAAQALAVHHQAEVVRFDVDDLEPLRGRLAAVAPRHVAVVLRPEQLEHGFVRRWLQLATEIDDDPFVDFAFGFVTGATADEAEALATRSMTRRPQPIERGVALVAVGAERSFRLQQPHALRRTRLPGLQLYCAGAEASGHAGRDEPFLRANLPAVSGRDVVMFAGHGLPDGVDGGPSFADLHALDLAGAVVLNVACYTGVTSIWYDDDREQGVLRRREVPPAESFCLALLRTGVVGYVAYVCPRPGGPELDTDLAAMVADGLSLGEARRRDYDKTVLGFLGYGEERLALAPLADGTPLAPAPDPVRDMMLEGATGGIVFGDPACVPFERRDGDAPVAIDVEPVDGALLVTARASREAAYVHCADPTAMWGDTLAMRVYARVPLGDRHVLDVAVDELRLGASDLESRVVWAVEDDAGQRYLQLKIMFPRPDPLPGALLLRARVATTLVAADGRRRGGESVQRDGVRQPIR